MDIAGYEVIGEILRSGSYVVSRARRVADRAPVLVKVPGRSLRGAESADLERECALLRTLTVEGAPRAPELVAAGSVTALVVEDRGLSPISERPGRPLDVAAFLRIATRLCATLGELHGRGLIYGSLRPSSTLASPDGGAIELLDFVQAARSMETKVLPPLADVDPAFISPEQTGRINRVVDHRTDFYSLGATLYTLLTGAPPFQSGDPLELMHAHIARVPVAPSLARPEVPEQLSRIVMRLMAKAAEDRYQSAYGVRHDFERCEQAWEETGSIPLFDLGTRDASDRFLISQRLYGREREVASLVDAIDGACAGRTALILVAGYPGIGKTALISELYRPIVRQRGYFIAGKFDQVVRNIPYGALVQAFRGLVWHWLAESEDALAAWRARVAAALGTSGGVLAEVLPDIEFVVGKQPQAPPLDPVEAQNRFHYVFQSFVGAVAQPEHPLVLFLDDLQWVDAATLDLLHSLLTSPAVRSLLVVGTYRDNEVDASHLLTWAIDRLDAAGAPVQRLKLGALGLADVTRLLRDTLRSDGPEVDTLAQLILRKTDGNPFFLIQFLKALQQDGLFRFDPAKGQWLFRVDAVAAMGVTDNVVDLLTREIKRLSPRAQSSLTLAACIGSPFDWTTFLTVSRLPAGDAAADLAEAVEAGLIQPATQYEGSDRHLERPATYAFVHDRVQQAAYSLIPESERQPAHLDVGRLLLAQAGPDVSDDRLFRTVGHLNMGSALMDDPEERLSVARLNLTAGRRAKLSTAYQAASAYLDQGLRLVSEEGWASHYELLFALHLEAAECHYLAGHFEQAEQSFELLLRRAVTPIEQAQVHSLRIVLYENLSRYADAIASGRAGLALFGISFPEAAEDIEAALEREIAAIRGHLGGRRIASLIELRVMANADTRMVLRILTSLWAPAYLAGNQVLTRLISATMVRLSLEHGNTEDSAYGYVTHAITVGPVRREYAAAYEWGELALQVNERFRDTKRRAKIQQQFHAHVKLWRRPFETCLPHAREARRSGLESGDFTYAGYAAVSESWPALVVSRSLDRFVREYSPALVLLDRIRMTDFRAALRVMLNWALALQGRTRSPLSLSDAQFDEEAFLATYRTSAPFFLTFFYTAKLHLCVLLEQWDQGVEMARRAREVTVAGTIWPVLQDFWGSLALAGAASHASEETRARCLADMKESWGHLGELADNCAENFRGFALIVESEIARLGGNDDRALTLLDEAMAYARDTENLQQEALAADMSARLWIARGAASTATPLLHAAHGAYARWGAGAKVSDLEARYASLLQGAKRSLPSPVAGEPAPAVADTSLDLATVLKVARAIASEIELPGLLEKLLRLALENAGAERGLFLQDRDGALTLEAEAWADREVVDVRQSRPFDASTPLAHAVVRYARRTGQPVVVADAGADERFAGDPYIVATKARSILCVPVGHQGRSSGVLYLENTLTADAFTPERAEMMRILAAQAAISLENARLYEATKTEIERRTVAERSLREALGELEVLKNRLETENVYLQEEIRTQHNFNEIVGNSPALLDVLRKVELVAPTESTVLILGETGSGKELFARAVHSRSARRDRPLVKVNCGAIAPGLVESELFGHVKGAFTGAIDKRIGRFEVANGGTILLDEIGELPLDAQVKLLRVLQEQEFEPVGSSRTVRVNVRVIAATNRDLETAVRDGSFRADLLYRLNVFPIEIPPLRERRDDIPLLVALFVTGLARRLGKPIQGFSARGMERLLEYSWPGNVRELQNVVERAAILARGPVLELERGLGGQVVASPGMAPLPADGETLDSVQRAHIVSVLKTTGWVVEGAKGAATILGLHPNTLRSRMKKLGIPPRPAS